MAWIDIVLFIMGLEWSYSFTRSGLIAERTGWMSTILVIEDEETVRRFLAINLKARGYEVIEASNGRDGLTLMREVEPALVLMDIRMPDLNGWEVLNQIGEDAPPIFLMTAYVLDAKACQEE